MRSFPDQPIWGSPHPHPITLYHISMCYFCNIACHNMLFSCFFLFFFHLLLHPPHTHCEVLENKLLSVLSVHHYSQSIEQSECSVQMCMTKEEEERSFFCYLCQISNPSLWLLFKIFRAMKILCMIPYDGIILIIIIIIQFSRSIECRTVGMNFNVNYGFWVIMLCLWVHQL